MAKSTSEIRDQRKDEGNKTQKKNSEDGADLTVKTSRDSRNRMNYLIGKVMYKALIGLTGGARGFLSRALSLFTYKIEA